MSKESKESKNNEFLHKELEDEIYTVKQIAMKLGYTYEGGKFFLETKGLLKRHKHVGLYCLKDDFDSFIEDLKKEIKK